MGIVEPLLPTSPVDALEVAPVDAGDVGVALLPPAELQAVAVTSMTAAAAPMKYLLLRMLFPGFVAPGIGRESDSCLVTVAHDLHQGGLAAVRRCGISPWCPYGTSGGSGESTRTFQAMERLAGAARVTAGSADKPGGRDGGRDAELQSTSSLTAEVRQPTVLLPECFSP
jgi:hypothetical protein